MAESKSDLFARHINGHFEKSSESAASRINMLAAFSKWQWSIRPMSKHGTTRSGGGRKKSADNPMDQDVEIRLANLRRAPRCRAMTRARTPCQRPALRGRRRCRLRGGLSPGAPRGRKNGNFCNGNWTADAIAERTWLRSLVQLFATTG
jgi:hypothetical protein